MTFCCTASVRCCAVTGKKRRGIIHFPHKFLKISVFVPLNRNERKEATRRAAAEAAAAEEEQEQEEAAADPEGPNEGDQDETEGAAALEPFGQLQSQPQPQVYKDPNFAIN